jgi:hypothetical protein
MESYLLSCQLGLPVFLRPARAMQSEFIAFEDYTFHTLKFGFRFRRGHDEQ